MEEPQSGRDQRGFTLIEMLVVMALLAILLTFAVPSLMTMSRKGKLVGAANQAAALMRLARLEAIKRSCTTLVRVVDAAGDSPERVEGIVDCNGDGVQDADRPPLGSSALPARVHLLAPPNLTGSVASVARLSPDPRDPGATNVAIFQGDGSVQEVGAFRFGDEFGNFLEVWVGPAATARVEVRKCLLCTNAADPADWYANGDGGRAWTWK